ncbi:hypothetical protein GCM10007884_17020 [Methylobacterium brachythecii]|uniref:Uncharacterized protein n=2 Tax=Methylobacterium brachythecii TaxID=1176177 RepID=A0ABQ6D074_9HYPH|nr:hypothetical protein GCM10007884_17020 [Methylobacterium brachythecii]
MPAVGPMVVTKRISTIDLLLKTWPPCLPARDVLNNERSMRRPILGIRHNVSSESARDVNYQRPERFEKNGIANFLSRAPETDCMLGQA